MIEFITERALPLALTVSIQTFAVSSMLMVGLRYSIGDLARPLRDISGVIVALVTNFVLVPLLAMLLLRVYKPCISPTVRISGLGFKQPWAAAR